MPRRRAATGTAVLLMLLLAPATAAAQAAASPSAARVRVAVLEARGEEHVRRGWIVGRVQSTAGDTLTMLAEQPTLPGTYHNELRYSRSLLLEVQRSAGTHRPFVHDGVSGALFGMLLGGVAGAVGGGIGPSVSAVPRHQFMLPGSGSSSSSSGSGWRSAGFGAMIGAALGGVVGVGIAGVGREKWVPVDPDSLFAID